MARPKREPEPVCPFIDRDDPRCAHRFTLSHVSEAFTYCLHQYTRCPFYHDLTREQEEGEREPEPIPQPITIFGRRRESHDAPNDPAPEPIPFRSTGT